VIERFLGRVFPTASPWGGGAESIAATEGRCCDGLRALRESAEGRCSYGFRAVIP